MGDFLADVFAAEKPCLTGSSDFEPAMASVLRKWRSPCSTEDALLIWTQIEPSPDILSLIRALRSSGIVVALATNQQAYRANFMTEALGYADHFDHLLFSCELGHAKPSPEYFSAALRKITLDPTQTLFIDDREINVSAARDCGLQAQLYHLSDGVERIHELLRRYGLTTT